MLSVVNISKSYSARYLFSNVSFNVGIRDRIAVIGQNGTGKTTLFEILAGNLNPDSGTLVTKKGTTTGYLHQDINPTSKCKLLEEVTTSSTDINSIAHKIKMLQEELTEERDDEYISELLQELGELQHAFESHGGYNVEHEARMILSGLGFAEADFFRPLNEFSGGWRIRVELAKLLFLKPDLLILDEPTNHLDLETTKWFENYLKTYQGAVLVTSHDRAFLNNIVKKVISIENEEVIFYHGNYDGYVQARQKDIEVRKSMAKKQDQQIKREMRFIERFRAKNTKATQVQSRIKKLEKIERIIVPRLTSNIKFAFPEPSRSGNIVITLQDIGKSYDNHTVYHSLNLVLNRGDKVALVGPNGAGKTTLLKILSGVLPFEKGERILGHNVETSYFAQYYIELLNPESTIIEELYQVAPYETEQRLRGLLGAFLFPGEDVMKKVAVLSGGEKTRIAIAKMLIKPGNFLLMDEPTNHLDIPSREILTDALESYNGTICFITHDRTLIREVANKIIEINDGQLQIFPGNYDDYLYNKEAREQVVPETTRLDNKNTLADSPGKYKQRQRKRAEGALRNELYQAITPIKKRIVEIEREVAKSTKRMSEIDVLFTEPEYYTNGEKLIEIQKEYRELKESTSILTNEWDSLTNEVERMTEKFETSMRNIEN